MLILTWQIAEAPRTVFVDPPCARPLTPALSRWERETERGALQNRGERFRVARPTFHRPSLALSESPKLIQTVAPKAGAIELARTSTPTRSQKSPNVSPSQSLGLEAGEDRDQLGDDPVERDVVLELDVEPVAHGPAAEEDGVRARARACRRRCGCADRPTRPMSAL